MKKLTITIFISALLILSGYSVYPQKSGDSSPILLEIKTKAPLNGNTKDGEIDIKISGGTEPYEIRCMGPEFNYKVKDLKDLTLKNLSNGQYLIIVKDQHGQIKHTEIKL